MIWVEILSRHHDVLDRFRCGDDARIGRAYDNDVVLDDPFVAPHHLRLARDDAGVLHVEDLGSVNGLHVDGDSRRQTRIALDGRQVLRIGRTLLRVRAAEFAVAPERAAGRTVRTWPIVAVLAIVVLALSALSLWLDETREAQPSRYVQPMLGIVLGVLIWTTAWTVLARIFTGFAQFDRHLLIALGGVVAFFLFGELTGAGAFALSWRSLAEYDYIGYQLLLAALCFVHLRAMGPRRIPAKLGGVAAFALAVIAAQWVYRSEESSLAGERSYLQGLKPPALRLKGAQSLGGFMGNTDRLKSALDKARQKPPGARGWFDADPDE